MPAATATAAGKRRLGATPTTASLESRDGVSRTSSLQQQQQEQLPEDAKAREIGEDDTVPVPATAPQPPAPAYSAREPLSNAATPLRREETQDDRDREDSVFWGDRSVSVQSSLFAGVWFFLNPLMGRTVVANLRSVLTECGARESAAAGSGDDGESEDDEVVLPKAANRSSASRGGTPKLWNGESAVAPAAPQRKSRFDFRETTHVVSTEIEFPEYSDCVKAGIQVVAPSWIYHAIVLKSLPKPEFHSPDPAQFMSGVIVAATDTIPPNDRACIFGGVLAFGGDYRERLAPDVTHLVALDTTGETYALAERRIRRQNLLAAAAQVATAPLSSSTAPSSSLLQIVLPHYFDDCLRIRRRVREDLYRLPNPKLFSIDPFAPPVFEPAATHSAPSTAANAFFLEGQVLFVHPGVWATESDPDRTKQLKEQIVAAGGLLVDEFDGERVTGAVVPSRQCKEYYLAEKAGKYVGSMRWLVDTINSRQLSSPRRKALHYPQPEPLAEFQHFMICTTNYSSVARQDIMTMVVHLGGQFTKTMTPRNTHVICAKPVSEKYTRALEWDITVVNHLWLEDTYVSHRLQIPTRLHYLYFPASLCPIVGETSIAEKEVVRSIAFFEAVHAVGIVNEKSVAASTDGVESDPLVDGGEDAGGPGKTPRLKSAGEGGASGSGGRRKIGLVVASSFMAGGAGSGGSGKSAGAAAKAVDPFQFDPVEEENASTPVLRRTSTRIPLRSADSTPGREAAKATRGRNTVMKEPELNEVPGDVGALIEPQRVEPVPVDPGGDTERSPARTRRRRASAGDAGKNAKENEASPAKREKRRQTVSGETIAGRVKSTREAEGTKKKNAAADVIGDSTKSVTVSRRKVGISPSAAAAVSKKTSAPTTPTPAPSLRRSTRPASKGVSSATNTSSSNGGGSGGIVVELGAGTEEVEDIDDPDTPGSTTTKRKRGRRSLDAAAAAPPPPAARAKKAPQPQPVTEVKARKKATGTMAAASAAAAAVAPPPDAKSSPSTAAAAAATRSTRKRGADAVTSAPTTPGTSPVAPPAKRPRVDGSRATGGGGGGSARKARQAPPLPMAVLTTSVTLSEEEDQFLQSKGVQPAKDVASCTHLVSPKVARTEKFMLALCLGKELVSYGWVHQSMQHGELLDPTAFPILDRDTETQFGFTLAASRARALKPGGLLAGRRVFATPHVLPDAATLRRIVEAAGGVMLPPTRTALTDACREEKEQEGGHEGRKDAVLVLSCAEDAKTHHGWIRALGKRIHHPEMLVVGVLKQELELDEPEFVI